MCSLFERLTKPIHESGCVLTYDLKIMTYQQTNMWCCCVASPRTIDTAPHLEVATHNATSSTHPLEVAEDLSQKCSPLSLDGKVLLGFCRSCYDGDTVTLNIQSPFGIHQWKVRLEGFDAPEMKTKDALEKRHAVACKSTLMQLVEGKRVIVQCGGFEKYGRLLARLYVRFDQKTSSSSSCEVEDIQNLQNLLDVNQWMMAHTPCVPYEGGTKKPIVYDNSKYHPMYLNHFH